MYVINMSRFKPLSNSNYETLQYFNHTLYSKELPNGHRYILCPIANAATVAQISVVNFGAADEKSECLPAGAAHFLEHLSFRPQLQKKKESVNSVNSRFDSHIVDKVGMYGPFKVLGKNFGGYQNADTTNSATRFMCEIQKEHAGMMIEELHRMLNEKVDGEKIPTEFKAVKNECSKSFKDDMLKMVTKTNKTVLSNGMSTSTIGEMGALKKVSGAAINRVKNKFYIESNITGVLVGAIDQELIDTYVELWGRGEFKPRPERIGLKNSEVQTMAQCVNTVLNGRCPIISVGWRSPMHQLNEVTSADMALKIIEHALARPAIKNIFEKNNFYQTGMYNPDTTSSSAFMFLAGTQQPDSSKFVSAISSALGEIAEMDLTSEVKKIRLSMEESTKDVTGMYNAIGSALIYGTWKTPAETLAHVDSLLANPASINSLIKETVKNHFRPEKLSVVIGLPRSAAEQYAPRNVGHVIPSVKTKPAAFKALSTKILLPEIKEHTHNSVLLHTPGQDSIRFTVKIPFAYSEANEAAHKAVANYINEYEFNSEFEVGADSSHDLLSLDVQAKTPALLQAAMTALKACMNKNKGFDSKRYAQFAAGSSMGLSPQAMRALMLHMYEVSPYTNAHRLPDQIQRVSFSTAQSHFKAALKLLDENKAFSVLGVDTNAHDTSELKRILKPFGENRELAGRLLHRERQSWGELMQHHAHEEFTLSIDGQDISTLSMFLYEEPQLKRAEWRLKDNISKSVQISSFPQSMSGMLMVGVPFQNNLDMIHAGQYVIDYLSNSMSGVLMAKLRWCDNDNSVEGGCYGANGGESNTTFVPGHHSLGIFAATLGAAKLPRALKITNDVLRNTSYPMDESDLKITESRRFGEHALKLGNPQGEIQDRITHQLATGAPVRINPMKAPDLEEVRAFEKIVREQSYFVALTPDTTVFGGKSSVNSGFKADTAVPRRAARAASKPKLIF